MGLFGNKKYFNSSDKNSVNKQESKDDQDVRDAVNSKFIPSSSKINSNDYSGDEDMSIKKEIPLGHMQHYDSTHNLAHRLLTDLTIIPILITLCIGNLMSQMVNFILSVKLKEIDSILVIYFASFSYIGFFFIVYSVWRYALWKILLSTVFLLAHFVITIVLIVFYFTKNACPDKDLCVRTESSLWLVFAIDLLILMLFILKPIQKHWKELKNLDIHC